MMKKNHLIAAFIITLSALAISCKNPANKPEEPTPSQGATAPKVLSATLNAGLAAADATDVPCDCAYLDITFDVAMDTSMRSIWVNQEFLKIRPEWKDGKTLRLSFPAGLSPGWKYRFSMNPEGKKTGIQSAAGQALAATAISFRTKPYASAPLVSSSTPADKAADIAATTESLTITFNQDMDTNKWSYTSGQKFLKEEPAWKDLRTLVISFPAGLSPGFPYAFKLNPTGHVSMTDTSGNPVAENTTISFTPAPYAAAPTLTSSTPADGSTGIDPATKTLVIKFNQDMKTNLVSYSTNQEGLRTSSTWTDLRTLAITFTSELSPGYAYTFTLNPTGHNSMTDTSGNPLAENTKIGFTPTPYADAPRILSALFPDGTNVQDATNVPTSTAYIDITFSQDMITNGYSLNRESATGTWTGLRTFRISNYPLDPNTNCTLTLNGTGSNMCFKNTSSKALPTTSLTFRTGD